MKIWTINKPDVGIQLDSEEAEELIRELDKMTFDNKTHPMIHKLWSQMKK